MKMIRRIVLFMILALNFIFMQNTVFAQDNYAKQFYLNNLQKKVESNWLVPSNSAGKSVVISFTLNKNGEVSDAEIWRSSNNEVFDKTIDDSFGKNVHDLFNKPILSMFDKNTDDIFDKNSCDTFDKSAIDAVYKAEFFGPLVENQDSLNILFFFSPDFTSVTITGDGTQVNNDNTNVSTVTNTIPAATDAFMNLTNAYPAGANTVLNVANMDMAPTVTDMTPTVDFRTYTENLTDKINSNWNPKTSKEARDAIVLIKVKKDGEIEQIKMQKSSNKKKFDIEICDSILRSVPLDPLPEDFNSDSKNIQLNFVFQTIKDAGIKQHYVTASATNQEGYDEYVEQVEKIMSTILKEDKYFCKKDVLLEMTIARNGKVEYAKLLNQSDKDNFIRKEFNRKTLATLAKTSFPPFSDELGVDSLTLDYRILTQRKRLFLNLMWDYVLNCFRTGLESFCVQKPENI